MTRELLPTATAARTRAAVRELLRPHRGLACAGFAVLVVATTVGLLTQPLLGRIIDGADFLAEVRPALDWLADTFDTSLRTVGVGVPWSQETGRAAWLGESAGGWRSLVVPHREWAGWLGATGHAVTLRGEAPVNAIAGESAWAYDDATLRKWLAGTGAKTAYIEPGSSWENGYCESFNSKLRDEFLNGEIFYSMKEIRALAERWRVHYDTKRPQPSLGYKPSAPEAWVVKCLGYGEVETATRFPLLHTPDCDYRSTKLAVLHGQSRWYKLPGRPMPSQKPFDYAITFKIV